MRWNQSGLMRSMARELPRNCDRGARNKGRCPTYVILTLSLRDKGGALCVVQCHADLGKVVAAAGS
jgi:hypothetical protein